MQNGTAHTEETMLAVFPEARKSLKDVDPELYDMIKDEKDRQK